MLCTALLAYMLLLLCPALSQAALPNAAQADFSDQGLTQNSLPQKDLRQKALPPLLQALSNNAVAGLTIAGRERLYSFFGLSAGRRPQDAVRAAYEFDSDAGRWYALPAVPGAARLGASALSLGGRIYIFGGFAVQADGNVNTSAEVWRFEPLHKDYRPMPALPVPVADTVALAYRDRYAILLGGWQQTGPTRSVQIFDSVNEVWLSATPLAGEAVFGHAGALLGDELVLCGGASASLKAKNQYQLRPVNACHRAFLDSRHLSELRWQTLPMHPGPPRFRAALVANAVDKRMVLLGGSRTPYRYTGLHEPDGGAAAQPAQPEAEIWALDLTSASWSSYGRAQAPTMDLRGALAFAGGWVTIGGMEIGPKVSPAVRWFGPP